MLGPGALVAGANIIDAAAIGAARILGPGALVAGANIIDAAAIGAGRPPARRTTTGQPPRSSHAAIGVEAPRIVDARSRAER